MLNLKDCQSLSRAKDELFTNKKSPSLGGAFHTSPEGINYIDLTTFIACMCNFCVSWFVALIGRMPTRCKSAPYLPHGGTR